MTGFGALVALAGGGAAVGSDECAGCHEDLSLAFQVTTHGRIAADQQEDTEPPPDEQKIEFRTGWQDSDTEGSLVRVAEYEVVGSNPVLGLYWATSPYETSRFDVNLPRRSKPVSSAAFFDAVGETTSGA